MDGDFDLDRGGALLLRDLGDCCVCVDWGCAVTTNVSIGGTCVGGGGAGTFFVTGEGSGGFKGPVADGSDKFLSCADWFSEGVFVPALLPLKLKTAGFLGVLVTTLL